MIANSKLPIVQPYLSFEGRCDEALEFYQKSLGAKVEFLMRFKDNPDKTICGNATPDKVMHCSFRVGETMLMASDGMCQGKANFAGIALSLGVATDAEAERVFAALSEGGQVQMPLTKTFYASKFGMVVDKFGVSWMVIVAVPMPAPKN
jgi:PhnB protein